MAARLERCDMSVPESLLLIGASVRAAAFSARRAGLHPWCADLFADADLRVLCPTQSIPAARYPQGFLDVLATAPPGPWLFTGALENHISLLRLLAQQRPLWGPAPVAIKQVRSPQRVFQVLREHGLPCPVVQFTAPTQGGRWLVKPRAGAGGQGIRFRNEEQPETLGKRFYYQQWLEGLPCAAIFLADGQSTRLLGVTRQLVGESWLGCVPFHYCGSLGPLPLNAVQQGHFERLGKVLASQFSLCGLFGVDAILQDDVPYPVEINPRYTASVEVLEYASGLSALALLRRVFDRTAPPPQMAAVHNGRWIGKAILFAPQNVIFPEDGPWLDELRPEKDLWQLPAFADIPTAGTRIEAGQPIFTLFAAADTENECQERLQRRAADMLHLLTTPAAQD